MDDSYEAFAAILDARKSSAPAESPAPAEALAPAAKRLRPGNSSDSFASPAPAPAPAPAASFTLLEVITCFSSVHALATSDLAVLTRILEAASDLPPVFDKLDDLYSLGLAQSSFKIDTAPELAAALSTAAKIQAAKTPASAKRGGKPSE